MVAQEVVTGLDVYDCCDALLLGLGREHGSKGGVTKAPDTLDAGVVLVVEDDEPARLNSDTIVLESETGGNSDTTNGDEHNARVNLSSECQLVQRI